MEKIIIAGDVDALVKLADEVDLLEKSKSYH